MCCDVIVSSSSPDLIPARKFSLTCLYSTISPVCILLSHLYIFYYLTCLYSTNSPVYILLSHLSIFYYLTCLYSIISPIYILLSHLSIFYYLTCLYSTISPVVIHCRWRLKEHSAGLWTKVCNGWNATRKTVWPLASQWDLQTAVSVYYTVNLSLVSVFVNFYNDYLHLSIKHFIVA